MSEKVGLQDTVTDKSYCTFGSIECKDGKYIGYNGYVDSGGNMKIDRDNPKETFLSGPVAITNCTKIPQETTLSNGITFRNFKYNIVKSTLTGILFKSYEVTIQLYTDDKYLGSTYLKFSVADYHELLTKNYITLYTRNRKVWTHSYDYAVENF